jgi:Heterokaryon incompatibility protein (HET)
MTSASPTLSPGPVSPGPSPFDEIVSRVIYEYNTLHNPRSIRLLSLKRAPKDGLLQCSVIEASLDHPPLYEALSYAWDAQTRDRHILCNGQAVPVTANCRAALKHLCPPALSLKPRLLWIDAVCIDQQSVKERNVQVRLMDEIYRKADQVVVWLGEGNPGSDKAFWFLGKVAGMQDFKANDERIPALVQHCYGEMTLAIDNISI